MSGFPRTPGRQTGCVIGAIALAVVGSVIWSRGVRQAASDDQVFLNGLAPIGFASTRGHCRDGQLTTGHNRYDYSLEGGLKLTLGDVKDVVIVAHGLNNSEMKAENRFGLARESLQINGFRGLVVGWSWDGSTNWDPFGATGYHEAKHNAIANGPKLARFLLDLHAASPKTRIHLIGYSMGARLVAETVLALDTDPKLDPAGWRVDTVHMLGAAIDDEELQIDSKYGRAIERRVGTLFNYYSPNDDKLGKFFPIKDGDRAVGRDDLEDAAKAPQNYVSRNVSSELKAVGDGGRLDPSGALGRNHSGYLGLRDDRGIWLDDGAMNVVAHDFGP